jgi:hypothetical protein
MQVAISNRKAHTTHRIDLSLSPGSGLLGNSIGGCRPVFSISKAYFAKMNGPRAGTLRRSWM